NIVVGSSEISQNTSEHAFRWTSANGMVDLGVPAGKTSSIAYAISGNGSTIVGQAYSGTLLAPTDQQAFIWDQAHGTRLLSSVLATDYGLDLTGWTLTSAGGLSDDGQTIVGYGTDPAGKTEAWVARLNAVPEPASALLSLCGAASLGLAIFAKRRFLSG